MNVQFADESVSENTITAWSWDLDGDSIEDSADQHPSHQYDAPGEYDVTLTVTTANGSDSETKDGYIVRGLPDARPDLHGGTDERGCAAGRDLHLDETEAPATGCDPTAWDWTFGDAGIASGEVAQHTYEAEGYYNVCLTVTVPGTSAQTCVVDYIDVSGGCASGNLCLTLLLAGYWDGTEQSTEAYLTVDFYADPDAAPSYRITNVQLDVDGTATIDLTAGRSPAGRVLRGRETPLNHLDVMSETALTVGGLTAAGLDADFTDPAQVACGEAALVFVGERWCAPGGDASGDGQGRSFGLQPAGAAVGPGGSGGGLHRRRGGGFKRLRQPGAGLEPPDVRGGAGGGVKSRSRISDGLYPRQPATWSSVMPLDSPSFPV